MISAVMMIMRVWLQAWSLSYNNSGYPVPFFLSEWTLRLSHGQISWEWPKLWSFGFVGFLLFGVFGCSTFWLSVP